MIIFSFIESLIKMVDEWSVSTLAEFIKKSLIKKVKIKGEVSQPKFSSGHLYFQLKDKHSSIRSIIWKYNSIPKEKIIEGQNLTIEGKLDFYGPSGSTNLIIEKIITMDDQGELFAMYEKIKKEFTEKGYFDQNRKKPLPSFIKNILILTSASGAALQDFIYNITNQQSKLVYDVIDVKVQGNECPSNICFELEKLSKAYDLIVITRGGGSFEDLFGFSKPELIETIFKCNLPVLSAIGHQVDNPLLDLIADCVAPTPSLAAQLIVDHNRFFLDNLEKIKTRVKENILDELQNQINELASFLEKIYKPIYQIINLRAEFQNQVLQSIQQNIYKLCLMENSVEIGSHSITLYDQGDIINTVKELELKKGKQIQLRWKDQEFEITIH